jgi:hypothetical protein
VEEVLTRRRLFVLCVLMIALLFGWIRWRDSASLRQLRELIQIPEAIDATAVLSHQQMEAIVSALQKSPVKPYFATSDDIQEIATLVRGQKNPVQMWILVTPLKPAAVSDFYQAGEHRSGWEIVENSPACCVLLRRGSFEMLISFSTDREGRGTQVVYSLNLEERKAPL